MAVESTDDTILVNWFSIETFNAKGKRTYYNSFVTDLAITRDTVAELAACGRARWKIENETFDVLETNGYNLEHNFGHGKKTLASILVTLNLLAFAFHTAAYLGVLAWRAAIIARGPMYRFFEHLRTVTAYVVSRPGPPAQVHRRGRDTATLTTGIPPSRHSTHLNTEPKRRKITTTPGFRIAAPYRHRRGMSYPSPNADCSLCSSGRGLRVPRGSRAQSGR